MLLFTDFRYAEAARAIDGVEFVQSQRSSSTPSARRSTAASVSRRARSLRRLGDVGRRRARARPAERSCRELRAVKDEAELDDDPRGRPHHRPGIRRVRRGALRRTHRARPRVAPEQIFHELGAHGTAFESIVGSGPTGALPHGRPTDRVVEPNTTRRRRRGRGARRLQLGLHAHVRDRRSSRRPRRGVRRLPARPARRAGGDARGRFGAEADAACTRA